MDDRSITPVSRADIQGMARRFSIVGCRSGHLVFPEANDDSLVDAAKSLLPDIVSTLFNEAGSVPTTMPNGEANTLLGRGSSLLTSLGTQGVHIRAYRRGGLLRHVNSSLFLGTALNSRLYQELAILSFLQSRGLSVSRPVAGYFQSIVPKVLYRCAIVTEAIEPSRNLLVEWQKQDCRQEEIEKYTHLVCAEIRKLIALGIVHVDLFPGNVLLSGSNSIVLIDFDKALYGVSGDVSEIRLRYTQRWLRGCSKHLSPDTARIAGRAFKDAINSDRG